MFQVVAYKGKKRTGGHVSDFVDTEAEATKNAKTKNEKATKLGLKDVHYKVEYVDKKDYILKRFLNY